jgi:MFS family permease
MGIIDSAFNAALNSIIPAILARDRVQKGNSLLQGAGGILAIIGNALGGVFMSTMGGALAFLLNGITYLCAAFASLFVTGQTNPPVRSAASYSQFIGEVKEGTLFIWANKGLRNQTLVYALSNLFFPTVMLGLPFLVEDVLHLGNAYYGYLLSMLTLSSILGCFVFGLFETTDRQNYVVICAIFFVEALLFLCLSFTENVFLVFGFLFLLSFCMAVSRLINTSLKQKVIPAALRGRVFGTLDSINGGLAPLSFALSGVIIDLMNKDILSIFFVICLIYTLLAILFVANGSIRHFYVNSVPAADTPSI